MKKYTLTALGVLIYAQLTLTVIGQNRDWNAYSSAADQFRVDLPTTIRMSRTFEGKDEASLDPTQRERLNSYISIYEDTAVPIGESKFRILVINGKAKIFDSLSRDNLLTYLSVMIIGDDDDPHWTSQRSITVNGLTGKEYVWAKKAKVFEYGWSLEIFKRGRIFDQGDKIYVLVFEGENAAELKSHVAERFLNSFRLHKAKTE